MLEPDNSPAPAPFLTDGRVMMLPVPSVTAVVSELPAWNTNTAFGFPPPSSVRVPVIPIPLAVE